MIRRITLENFMSHKHSVLELADGLTVLFGPNNCGKSAVVAAIEAVCRNDALDYAIRHDTKAARVTIETEEGRTVTWERRRGSSTYFLDGERIDRTGRGKAGVPEEVQAALKLPLASVGTDEGKQDLFELHFGLQKAPIFLLQDQAPGRRVAQFMGMSSDAGKLLEIQQVHERRTRERTSRRKDLQVRLAATTEREAALAPIDALEGVVTGLEAEQERLESLERAAAALDEALPPLIAALDRVSGSRERAGALAQLEPVPELGSEEALQAGLLELRRTLGRHQRIESLAGALGPLPEPPLLAPEGELAGELSSLRAAMKRVARAEALELAGASLGEPPQLLPEDLLDGALAELRRVGRLHGRVTAVEEATRDLSPAPEQYPEAALASTIGPLRAAQRGTRHASALAGSLETLGEPPQLLEPSALVEALDRLRTRLRVVEQATARWEACGALVDPPELLDLRELELTCGALHGAERGVSTTQAALSKAQAELRGVDQEIVAWVAEHPACPTCGAELDPARVVPPHEAPHG